MRNPLGAFRFRWSIATVLTLGMVLTVLSLIITESALDIRRERAAFWTDLEQRGRLLAGTLDDLLTHDLYVMGGGELRDIAQAAAKGPAVAYVQVFTPDGRLLVGPSEAEYAMGPAPSSELWLNAVEKKQLQIQRRDDALEVASPLVAGEKVIGVVQFALSTKALKTEIRETILSYVWQGLALMVLGVGASYLMGQYLSRPLRQLARAANRVAEGELQFSSDYRRNDEIGDLAFAFEEMTRNLREATARLESANESLLLEIAGHEMTEEALLHEQRVLASIQASMTEGLIVLDEERRIAYFNESAEKLTGLKAAKMLGRPAGDVLSDISRDIESTEMTVALAQILQEGLEEPTSVEGVLLTPERRDVVTTIFPVTRSDGPRMIGFLLRDVTQERELERRRDEFVSIASHELRTPLTSVKGFAELVLDKDPPTPVRQDWLGRVLDGAGRLMAIVDDLLSVSRIQSGELALTLERQMLQDATERALATVHHDGDKHDVVVEMPPDTPEVVADRDKLAQVLTNLLDNAIKYSPTGGRITVSARHEPEREQVVVMVADQGIGIAPEDQERIFNTFERIRQPETDNIGGTGLGLYIVKELVERMGGEVWLESARGEGATFFFSLPTRQVATER